MSLSPTLGFVLNLTVNISWLTLVVVLVYEGLKQYRAAGTTRAPTEPLNLFVMAGVALFLLVITNIKINFTETALDNGLTAMVMALVPLALAAVMGGMNVIQYGRKIPKQRRYGIEVAEDAPTSVQRKLDARRKFFHLFIFVTIFIVLVICDGVLRYMAANAATPADQANYAQKLDTFWGATDGLGYVAGVFRYESLPMGRAVVIFYFYVLSCVFLFVELTRLSAKVHFPLHKTIQKTLRYKELDGIASYTHFAVGFCFAALVLPPLLFLAALSLVSFADAAASTVGIKYGKRRYAWNGKSLEGSLAGFACAFVPVLFLGGWVHALVAAAIFVGVDLATPEPIALSDNLLIPITVTLAFAALSLAGVPATSVFL